MTASVLYVRCNRHPETPSIVMAVLLVHLSSVHKSKFRSIPIHPALQIHVSHSNKLISKVIYTFSTMEITTVSNKMSSTQRRFPVNKEEAINRQYLPPASFWWQILFLVEEYFKDKSTFCQTLTKVRALLHEIVFRNCHISQKKLPSFRPGRFSLIIWQSWGELECVAFYLSMI